jgi:drug/metabolite transporter (DMT)-like permease
MRPICALGLLLIVCARVEAATDARLPDGAQFVSLAALQFIGGKSSKSPDGVTLNTHAIAMAIEACTNAGGGRVLVPAGFIFLWSSAYVVVRLSLPDMSPIASLALRFAIATVVLLALARRAGQPPAVLGRRWPHFVVAGLLMNGIYPATAYLALQYLAAGTMGLLATLNPMLTALLGWILLGERMRLVQWLGLALGVTGVVLVVGVAPVPGQSVPAALLAVGGIVCFALGTIYFRRYCGGGWQPVLRRNNLGISTQPLRPAMVFVSST